MPQLAVALLGPAEFMRAGAPVGGFESDKVRALLIYLLVEDSRPHRRTALAELLWPERPERAGLLNLNQALANLRRTLGERAAATPLLLVTRESIQRNPAAACALDVAAFGALLAACERHPHRDELACAQCAGRRAEAAALYRGDFLAQFAPRDCLEFQEWALTLRERLRRQALHALAQLAAYHERAGAPGQALPAAFRQAELDPWDEAAHRQLMRLLLADGQRSAALAQYERCRAILAEQLGIEPEPATTALYEAIRSNESAVSAAPEPAAPSTAPSEQTPFVGRAGELAQLANYLNRRDCRLVTIVGLGGSGKTRLALRVAEQQRRAFTAGVAVALLAAVRADDLILPAIAQAAGLALGGADDPLDQLAAHLRGKQLLLVLDNLEHLPAAAPLVAALLERAPGLAVLATSCERLQLRGEWVLNIGGLDLPEFDDLEASAAGALFLQSARRALAGFTPGPAERQAIARLCRMLAGHPLGIELAAAWVHVLSCAEIAAEVAANFGLPADLARDRPDRHRSMRALLASTWQLLPADERLALARLALFRGGFDRAGAAAVAGAGLAQLAALADRALLARVADGRFAMHPLVQQYAAEQLEESGDAAIARRQFVAHLAHLTAQAEPHLKGAEEQIWLDRLAAEHDNLRAALELALAEGMLPLAARMCAVLRWFWYIRGYISEGRQWIERVLAAATAGGEPIAPATRARLLQGAGVLASDQADYPHATAYFQACVALNHELGDAVGVQAATHSLGLLAVEQGDYAAAQASFEQSLAVCRELGHTWGVANRLNSLGTLAYSLCQPEQALVYLEEALAVARPLGNEQLSAMILGNLADVALAQGDLARAGAAYRSALAQYRALGDPRSAALAHQGLGVLALRQGDLAEAARQLREGLAISWASANRRDLAAYLGYMASLWLAQGRPAEAVRLCAAIEAFRARARIPMAPLDQRQHAATLASAHAALDPALFQAARAEGQLASLDSLIEAALSV